MEGKLHDHTFGNGFGVGHVHVHLRVVMSHESGPRDQARRDGDDLARPVQLALPPQGAQQLDEFGRAVEVVV